MPLKNSFIQIFKKKVEIKIKGVIKKCNPGRVLPIYTPGYGLSFGGLLHGFSSFCRRG